MDRMYTNEKINIKPQANGCILELMIDELDKERVSKQDIKDAALYFSETLKESSIYLPQIMELYSSILNTYRYREDMSQDKNKIILIVPEDITAKTLDHSVTNYSLRCVSSLPAETIRDRINKDYVNITRK